MFKQFFARRRARKAAEQEQRERGIRFYSVAPPRSELDTGRDLLNPLNPLSPLWIGNADNSEPDPYPAMNDVHAGLVADHNVMVIPGLFDGGSSGGAGASGSWTSDATGYREPERPYESPSYDYGSSSSYDSGSSSGGCD